MRFLGFDDAWDYVRVSDLIETYSTNSLSWDMLDYENGTILNLHYGLIHSGLPTQIDCRNDKLPFIKCEYMPKHYTLCEEGDIAFADASEDTEEVGKVVEFNKCNEKDIVCGLHTIHARDKVQRTVVGYKGYAFSSVPFHHQIRRIAQGTKIYSINTRNFEEVYIGVPSKAEQRKIADFLCLIDERINTQSKIIKEIDTLKKSICNKLFGNLNWEKYRVGDIGTLGRGRVISTSEINSSVNPKYPVYSSQTSNSGVMGYIDTYEFDGEYITWTTDGANAGTVFYRNGKFNCTNVCGTIKLNNTVDAYFVAYALQQAAKKYVSTNLANPKLMNNVMADICIYCPDLATQKRISSLVRLLDEKIAIEEQILNGYKESKHYLLSNLFI